MKFVINLNLSEKTEVMIISTKLVCQIITIIVIQYLEEKNYIWCLLDCIAHFEFEKEHKTIDRNEFLKRRQKNRINDC